MLTPITGPPSCSSESSPNDSSQPVPHMSKRNLLSGLAKDHVATQASRRIAVGAVSSKNVIVEGDLSEVPAQPRGVSFRVALVSASRYRAGARLSAASALSCGGTIARRGDNPLIQVPQPDGFAHRGSAQSVSPTRSTSWVQEHETGSAVSQGTPRGRSDHGDSQPLANRAKRELLPRGWGRAKRAIPVTRSQSSRI